MTKPASLAIRGNRESASRCEACVLNFVLLPGRVLKTSSGRHGGGNDLGRKTKTRTDRVVQRVVRLSIEEDLAIGAKATGAGYSSNASFLRDVGLDKRMRTAGKLDREFQKQIWKQVSGIGRNINQIAFKLNSGSEAYPGEFKAILEEIKELRADLENIGLEKPV